MKDEYLWDKSGEPDREIQQLEEILGTLKYQSRPLAIPPDLVVFRRRRFLAYLAIAASLAFALLAASFWLLRVQNQKIPQSYEAGLEKPKPALPNKVERNNDSPVVEKKDPAVNASSTPHRKRSNSENLGPAKLAREREEALAAKQQLILALRLASEKLNLAQKKTLNASAPNQIRNQHKVG